MQEEIIMEILQVLNGSSEFIQTPHTCRVRMLISATVTRRTRNLDDSSWLVQMPWARLPSA
jgi:hypothetical protein